MRNKFLEIRIDVVIVVFVEEERDCYWFNFKCICLIKLLVYIFNSYKDFKII